MRISRNLYAKVSAFAKPKQFFTSNSSLSSVSLCAIIDKVSIVTHFGFSFVDDTIAFMSIKNHRSKNGY